MILSMALPKLAVFLGTPPEAIKLAPVVRSLRELGCFEVVVVNTGQHVELLQPHLSHLGLQVDVQLEVMEGDSGLPQLYGRIQRVAGQQLRALQPVGVIVQGDTATAAMTAQAAFLEGIPIAHVEAGLRSGSSTDPFPEEMNRRLISQLCKLHLAPTEGNRAHLLAEGIDPALIAVTGNPVVDALLHEQKRQEEPEVRASISKELSEVVGCELEGEDLVLVTVHRRENFGPKLINIIEALVELVHNFPDHHFIVPQHLNPEVQLPFRKHLGDLTNLHLVPALDHPSFVHLLSRAILILSDSGGVQEEAPALGTPVLLLRETTERPEALQAGLVDFVGTEREAIVEAATTLLDHPPQPRTPAFPFGQGDAGDRIAAFIGDHWS